MRASPQMKWFILLLPFVFAIGMNSFRNSFPFSVVVCIVFVGVSAGIELVPFLDKQKAKETHQSL